MTSLIVGLGNIGKRYENTRHNLGFNVVDAVIKKVKPSSKTGEPDYELFTIKIGNRKITLAKPTTMMNGSGTAVNDILYKLDIEPREMLVIIDDFNIPLGSIRFRPDGSAGGHNGLDSIITELQTENFPRLRLGIGPVPEGNEEADFVLEEFSQPEQKKVDKMIGIAAEAVIFAAGHRFEETMSKYNYNPV